MDWSYKFLISLTFSGRFEPEAENIIGEADNSQPEIFDPVR